MDDLEARRTALRDAIAQLYSVFRGYPLEKSTGACPCCHTPDEEAAVHARPLEQLLPEELEGFARDALLTWGGVEDFKHFLPRIFELFAETDWVGWVDGPIVLAKLRHANWLDWAVAEKDAVQDYLTAVWRLRLADVTFPRETDDLICALGHAIDDLTPYLAEWRGAGLVGQHLLAELVVDDQAQLVKNRKLANPFWGDRKDQMKQVVDWLLEPGARDALEQAYLENSDDPLTEVVPDAVYVLELLAGLYPADVERNK